MRAHGLVLVRDSEPGEPSGGHVTVPEPNRRLATDLTTVWTRRAGVVALVPTIDCGDPTAVLEVTKDQYGAAILASPVETKFVAAFGRAPEHDEVSPEGTKSEESRATLVPVLQEIGVRAGSSTFANERMLVGASSWRMGRYRGCPLSRVAGHQVAADTTLAIRGVS